MTAQVLFFNDFSEKDPQVHVVENDLNLSVFNMITGKNLTKHISCEWKCRFDGKSVIQINGRKAKSVDLSIEKVMYVKKIIFGIFLDGKM